MSVIQALKRRARFLATGAISFLVVLAAFHWSAGEPLLQSQDAVALIIGFVIVAAYVVFNDVRGGGVSPGSRPGSRLN
jgi:glycerol uptake facilitator-like aquaporin